MAEENAPQESFEAWATTNIAAIREEIAAIREVTDSLKAALSSPMLAALAGNVMGGAPSGKMPWET